MTWTCFHCLQGYHTDCLVEFEDADGVLRWCGCVPCSELAEREAGEGAEVQ